MDETTPEQERPEDPGQAKPAKTNFIYGNYNRYYGYRIGRTLEEDPRLRLLRREWFEGKRCLDIGCNVGFVTMAIASKYRCTSMLGVDIDAALIVRARAELKQQYLGDAPQRGRKHKHKNKRKRGMEQAWSEPSHVAGEMDADSGAAASDGVASPWCRAAVSGDEARATVSSPGGVSLHGGADSRGARQEPSCGPHGATACSGPDVDDTSASAQQAPLADIVSFKRQDFLEASHPPGSYDTVLCLSVTKWVHLNWGDDGLLKLFQKIYAALEEGGVLILEPQPWKSYKQNKKVSQAASENFSKIVIRPSMFEAYLVHQIGFRQVEVLSTAVPGSTVGFDRPILACYK